MERQLVKQGRGALTLTLPAKWIQKNNLTDKDAVRVIEENNKLIITSNSTKLQKEIKVNIKNMPKSLAFHIIMGKYILGYDKIIIEHNNYQLAQQIGNNFLGFVIEKLDEKTLIIKDIIKEPQDNFLEIFKRNCQMLIFQARLLKKQLKKEIEFKEIKKEERLLDKNIFYCLRYINKYETLENSYQYFLLTTTIESIGDYISEISKYISKTKKISNPDKKNIDLIVENIEMYIVYLFQEDILKMYDLLRKFKKEIHKNSFIGGVTYSIEENLFNFIGYLIKK